MTYKQDCDNSPTEGATNRVFSSKAPLKYFVQALAGLLAALDLEVVIAHLPRAMNEWADGLSREFPATLAQFSPKRRIRLSPEVLLRIRTGQRVFPVGAVLHDLKVPVLPSDLPSP